MRNRKVEGVNYQVLKSSKASHHLLFTIRASKQEKRKKDNPLWFQTFEKDWSRGARLEFEALEMYNPIFNLFILWDKIRRKLQIWKSIMFALLDWGFKLVFEYYVANLTSFLLLLNWFWAQMSFLSFKATSMVELTFKRVYMKLMMIFNSASIF